MFALIRARSSERAARRPLKALLHWCAWFDGELAAVNVVQSVDEAVDPEPHDVVESAQCFEAQRIEAALGQAIPTVIPPRKVTCGITVGLFF